MYYCCANPDVPLNSWKLLNFFPAPTPRTKTEAIICSKCYVCEGKKKVVCTAKGCKSGFLTVQTSYGSYKPSCETCNWLWWHHPNNGYPTPGYIVCSQCPDSDPRAQSFLAIRKPLSWGVEPLMKSGIYYWNTSMKYPIHHEAENLITDYYTESTWLALRSWAAFTLLQEEKKLNRFWPLYQASKADAGGDYFADDLSALEKTFSSLVPKPKRKKSRK